LVAGICFEAALDAAGETFVLRDVEDLIRFYDLADNSQLCRQPVERIGFDFAEGDVVAGLWSAGTGCTADYDVIQVYRDEAQIIFHLRFVTVEGCNYELVRPFWVVVSGGYDVILDVENP